MSYPRKRLVEASARKRSIELRSIRVVFEADPDADASYLEHEELATRRAEYRRGDFHFVRVQIVATVSVAETEQRLVSPGLGGIESDTIGYQEEIDEIVAEEWRRLRAVLLAVGVSSAELPLEASRE